MEIVIGNRSDMSKNLQKNWEKSRTKKVGPQPDLRSEIAILKEEIDRMIIKEDRKRRMKFIFNYEEGIKNLNRSQYKVAIKHFEKALKIDPNHYEAQRYLIEAINADLRKQRQLDDLVKQITNVKKPPQYVDAGS